MFRHKTVCLLLKCSLGSYYFPNFSISVSIQLFKRRQPKNCLLNRQRAKSACELFTDIRSCVRMRVTTVRQNSAVLTDSLTRRRVPDISILETPRPK
ncbi:hypothetical protein CDAR_295421 [Caerostris darwini]|uniref:Secreted protein n=1 Tax=Caerostris darwini TaxID=1538125 RepID=A0AAV4QPB9_9ARAC|nr:hypothetical protein CDAR_295421 [Caerostris darwini]